MCWVCEAARRCVRVGAPTTHRRGKLSAIATDLVGGMQLAIHVPGQKTTSGLTAPPQRAALGQYPRLEDLSMTNEPTAAASLHQVAIDHHQLHDLVGQLSFALRGQQYHTADLARLFHELELLLIEHFAREERGGYFEGIIEARPNLKSRVDALIVQHARMLQAVCEMQSRLGQRQLYLPSQEMARAFDEFLGDFEAHEAEENDLVQDAHLQDLGEEG
jgi:hypothetical protein